MYVRQNKSQLGIATNRGFNGLRRGLGQATPVVAPPVPAPVAAPAAPETTVVKDGSKIVVGCIAVWLLLKLLGYI